MSQTESQKRKRLTGNQKVAILKRYPSSSGTRPQAVPVLKRYLVDKASISDLCDEYGIQPSQVYPWQKVLFESGEAAFERTGRRDEDPNQRKVAALKAKLQQKNEVNEVIDGYSRYIVHWEIRETMKEREVEVIVQRAREKCPRENPGVISDNGPQFIAKDFKEFIRLCGMTRVRMT